MHASDIMSTDVISVGTDSSVVEIASQLRKHGISAVPVVDTAGKLVGLVSEGASCDALRAVRRPTGLGGSESFLHLRTASQSL